jgi:hypothetical protein
MKKMGMFRKKSSPQNLWISLLIVLRSSANSAANSRLTPGCLFIEHSEPESGNHKMLGQSPDVYVLAFIFVHRGMLCSFGLWIRRFFL